jgi:hypothetical protein
MPGDETQPRNAVGIIGRIEPFEDTVETSINYYKQTIHIDRVNINYKM